MNTKKKNIVQKQKKNYDSWVIVTFVLLAFYIFFMIYPMISLVKQSFMDKETGVFSMVRTFFPFS